MSDRKRNRRCISGIVVIIIKTLVDDWVRKNYVVEFGGVLLRIRETTFSFPPDFSFLISLIYSSVSINYGHHRNVRVDRDFRNVKAIWCIGLFVLQIEILQSQRLGRTTTEKSMLNPDNNLLKWRKCKVTLDIKDFTVGRMYIFFLRPTYVSSKVLLSMF